MSADISSCVEVTAREISAGKKCVVCMSQKEDAQNAIIRNNLDMERTLGGWSQCICVTDTLTVSNYA